MKWLRGIILSLLFATAALAQVGQIPSWPPLQKAPAGGGAYVGPLDNSLNGASTIGWWGLRAGSAALAAATTNLADLVDTATGAATCTLKANTSGDADVTSLLCVGATLSVTTFCTVTHPAGCSVAKLYDQSGTGNHVTQATLTRMPQLSFAPCGFRSGRVAMKCDGTIDIVFLFGGSFSQSPAISMSAVANRTTNGAAATQYLFDDNSSHGFGWTAAASTFFLANSSSPTTASTDSTLHTYQVLTAAVGANSIISVDGTNNTVNTGSTTTLGTLPVVARVGSGSIVYFGEVGVWAGDMSANNAAMNTNQQYWF